MPRHSSVLGGKAGSLQPASLADSQPAAATKPSQGVHVGLQVGRDWGEPLSYLSAPQFSLIVSKSVPFNPLKPSFLFWGIWLVRGSRECCLYGKRSCMCLVVLVGPGCCGEDQHAALLAVSGWKAQGAWQGAGKEGARPRGLQAPHGEPPGRRAACPLGQVEFIPMPDVP